MGEAWSVPPGSPWWVVAVAALPSLASGSWVMSRWWLDRADRKRAHALTREERLVREVEARRAALSREQAALFDRIRAELVRCQTRLAEMERDRDRGWDLARHWHRRSHQLRHAGLNAQTIVAGLCERENLAVPEWPDMSVAMLEEPEL
jgi:hypothetical protein